MCSSSQQSASCIIGLRQACQGCVEHELLASSVEQFNDDGGQCHGAIVIQDDGGGLQTCGDCYRHLLHLGSHMIQKASSVQN